MSITTLLPPALLENYALVARELPRTLITRSNFIPGVRHLLGWRGVRDCAAEKNALTVRVTGTAGVYALQEYASDSENKIGQALFRIFYFPAPNEDMVENFSVQAGIAAQADDYLKRVREFASYDDLKTLFGIADLKVMFFPDSRGIVFSLTAQDRDRVIALDGLVVETEAGTVQAVPPKGVDQDLPAWNTALPLFEALAASASYCLETTPQSMLKQTRPGRKRVYETASGLKFIPSPELQEISLGLGWDAFVPENNSGFKSELRWSAPEPIPKGYAQFTWWTSNVPGGSNSMDKQSMGIATRPRLIVLTGFLGSGKTSFLTRFIEEQAGKNSFVAVVQNEIGQKGLDSKLLGESYAVTEVDEGCVCCTLAGSLRSALSGILAEFQPDFVVLETTGLANPANLLSEIADLEDMLCFASVTTILDAAGASQALTSHEVARSQVRLADVLVVNKTDLASREELAHLKTSLRKLNPVADLHHTRHGDISAAILYGVNFRKPLKRPALHIPIMGHAPTHQDDAIASSLLAFDAPLKRAAFEHAVAALPEQVLRAKGVIQFTDSDKPEVFQYVPGQWTLSPAEFNASEFFIVIIGQNSSDIAAEFLSG